MTEPVFLYGTLCDPELYQIVSGEAFAPRDARLPGMAIHWVAGESFPIAILTSDSVASGMLVAPGPEARARLDFYELGFGYEVQHHQVETDAGPVQAAVYVPEADWPIAAQWSLVEWQAQHGTLTRLAAQEYMGLRATHSSTEAARAFPQIRTRVASRLRAKEAPSPEPLTPKMSGMVVPTEKTAQPYTDYFAVREDWLSFPTFSGGSGPVVKRASFLGGDAVTVLPYDPQADSVLMVRQFRHGPFARGDGNPWTLEPAAGRIEVGEAPEETARRELFEETGVRAGEMHFVGRYYPSPGAFSEYIYSYVALADLSGVDGGIGGLEEEAEDIMRHVVPFSEAMAMVESGAANTAPLILSLSWLAMNKDRLT